MTFYEFERRQEDRLKTRIIGLLLALNIAISALACWLAYSALSALDVFRAAMSSAIEATRRGPPSY